MFPASLDRETFEKIDIIQFVGDSIYKDKKTMAIIEYILILLNTQHKMRSK